MVQGRTTAMGGGSETSKIWGKAMMLLHHYCELLFAASVRTLHFHAVASYFAPVASAHIGFVTGVITSVVTMVSMGRLVPEQSNHTFLSMIPSQEY